MRIVRKYKSRKLYDTATQQYITAEDLVRVAAVEDVKVVEEGTGRDLTAYALALGIAQSVKSIPSEELVEGLRKLAKELHPPAPMLVGRANGSARTAR